MMAEVTRRVANRGERSMKGLIWAVVVMILGAPTPARSDVKKAYDPNDTHGVLDVRRVSHGHRDGKRLLSHRVDMFEPWKARRLTDETRILLWFSTDREDKYVERRVAIYFAGGHLAGSIEKYDESSDSASVSVLSKNLRVTRPTRRSVKVFVPRRYLNPDMSRYKWSASTFYKFRRSRHCRRTLCQDGAPNDGKWIVHRL